MLFYLYKKACELNTGLGSHSQR